MQNLLQNPIIQGLLTNAIWEWGKATKEVVKDFALQIYINMQLKALGQENKNILDAKLVEAIQNNPEKLSKDLAEIAQNVPQEIIDIESKDELQEVLKSYLKELKITKSFEEIDNSNIEIKEYEKIDDSFKNINNSTIKLG